MRVVLNAALPTGSGGRAVIRTVSGTSVLSPAIAGEANPNAAEHKAAVLSSLRIAGPCLRFREPCPRNFGLPVSEGQYRDFAISEPPPPLSSLILSNSAT